MFKVVSVLALSLGVMAAANAEPIRSVDNHAIQRDTAVMPAPEIDPASAISAFTLLAGGLAMVRGRRSAVKKD